VSLPTFFAATPQEFMEAVDALQPDPASGAPDPAKIGAYIAARPHVAASFAAGSVPSPVSYGTVRYWALHAYTWVDPAGQRQAVRYRWEPEAGVAQVPEDARQGLAPDYLTQELRRRVGAAPVGFTLHVQLAADEDPTDDSTIAWPDDRPDIAVGRLLVTAPVDNEEDADAMAYDPTNITPGIELSDDPLLSFRSRAYAESARRRFQER
jgi:catalase